MCPEYAEPALDLPAVRTRLTQCFKNQASSYAEEDPFLHKIIDTPTRHAVFVWSLANQLENSKTRSVIGAIVRSNQLFFKQPLELLIHGVAIQLVGDAVQSIFQHLIADPILKLMQIVKVIKVRMPLTAALALVVFPHHFQILDQRATDLGSRRKIALDRIDSDVDHHANRPVIIAVKRQDGTSPARTVESMRRKIVGTDKDHGPIAQTSQRYQPMPTRDAPTD